MYHLARFLSQALASRSGRGKNPGGTGPTSGQRKGQREKSILLPNIKDCEKYSWSNGELEIWPARATRRPAHQRAEAPVQKEKQKKIANSLRRPYCLPPADRYNSPKERSAILHPRTCRHFAPLSRPLGFDKPNPLRFLYHVGVTPCWVVRFPHSTTRGCDCFFSGGFRNASDLTFQPQGLRPVSKPRLSRITIGS